MDPTNSQGSSRGVIIGIVVVLCCICALIAGLGAAGYYYIRQNVNSFTGIPTLSFLEPTVAPTVTINRPPSDTISAETENTLKQTIVPDNDLYDLGCRLRNVCNVAKTVPSPAKPYKVGDKQQFWIQNSDTSKSFQVTAILRYITPHSYMWVEEGVNAQDADIKPLMDTFENKIYPTDRSFFGSEWTPGVDDDPHLYIVYVRNVGNSTGGYYSSQDEYNPLVYKYSNAHELFVFNADAESLTDEYTYGTLAHEFQHMIHWNLDRNEEGWINEGFSEVASVMNGYSVGGADAVYAENPDLPLTEWTDLSSNPDVTTAHYGEAFLFLDYFLDRFGEQVTQAVVKNPENGLQSLDDTLSSLHVTDKASGQAVTADDVVMDWMATMYLQDGSVGDGRYAYHNYKDAPQVAATETIDTCPQAPQQATVGQYGADYIEVTCPGDHTLSFTGATVTKILPTDAHSGKFMFWSNKEDLSDTTLTREFDFTSVSGPLTFSYWTWYDLEKGFDYAYLEASADGQTWKIVKTPSCTEKDESGNSYGCGYNAESGGGDAPKWIEETVDLSAYAGKKVQLRFEYVTDPAVVMQGMLLDQLSIPAINYTEDFENGDGGWQGQGFVRVENALPQTFRLSLILKSNGQTTVQYVPVNSDQTAEIPLSLKQGDSAVLIVAGTQRY